jgi:protein involved in polysaccharide export with SLBB domain
VGSDTVQPGDTLSLQIWENVETGLLASSATGAAALEEVQVDGDGFIFVPYAGRLRASGNSTEAIRRLITESSPNRRPIRRCSSAGSRATGRPCRSWARSARRASTRSTGRPARSPRCSPVRAA